MDWVKLLKLIPVAAGAVNPMAGIAGEALLKVIEAELDAKAAADPTFDRDAFIAEAGVKWDDNIRDAQALLDKGHSNL